jgi:hypothetical protein
VDEESLHVIIQAYDDAWSLLRSSIFAAHPRTRETQEMLERPIIEMARAYSDMPRPSCQRILIRLPLAPLNTQRSPACGSRCSASCTCIAKPFMPSSRSADKKIEVLAGRAASSRAREAHPQASLDRPRAGSSQASASLGVLSPSGESHPLGVAVRH